MRRFKLLICLFLALFALPALAVLPETGLYYNPQFQGLGYYIEVEGSTLVFVIYAHDKATGKPLFYVASGPVKAADPGHGNVPASPPPPPYAHEYPQQFEGTLYRFDEGPCVTCMLQDWHPGEHAVEAGQVHLRMADVNRVEARFSMADGATSEVELWRQGFGMAGYDLGRSDGRSLPDMRGDWVFVARGEPLVPALRFNFSEVVPPQAVSGAEAEFHGRTVSSKMSFVDPVSQARLTCTSYGCALAVGDETLFLVKFQDIGTNTLLGYDGDTLFQDDGSAFEYRTDDLFIGKRMVDLAPGAGAVEAPPGANAVLLMAAETAHDAFPETTVVGIELDGQGTYWEAKLAFADGVVVKLHVRLDGTRVLGEPHWPSQDAADKAEWRQRLAGATLDYQLALAAVLAARSGDVVELSLDDWHSTTVAWEADVLVDGVKYKVVIDAGDGSVLENRRD